MKDPKTLADDIGLARTILATSLAKYAMPAAAALAAAGHDSVLRQELAARSADAAALAAALTSTLALEYPQGGTTPEYQSLAARKKAARELADFCSTSYPRAADWIAEAAKLDPELPARGLWERVDNELP